jgi:hypothetical protein
MLTGILRLFALLIPILLCCLQSYGQVYKYRVNYSVTTNVTNPPSNYDRVITMSIDNNKLCYDFVVGSCTGTFDVVSRPATLTVTGYKYNSSRNLICQDPDTYSLPGSDCNYPQYWGTVCESTYNVDFDVIPLINVTGPAVDPNKNYCPSEQLNFTATSGFSGYRWQYKVDNGNWVNIKTTTTSTTTLSGADIGNNFMKNIYIRAVEEMCNLQVIGTVAGPYTFSPGYAGAVGPTSTPPSCHNGKNGIITVSSLSRSLKSGEVAQVTLYDATSNAIGQTLQTSTLPIVLDGANTSRFPNGIGPGNYTLLVETFFGGTKPSNCGTPVNAPITVDNRDLVVASAAISSPVGCIGSQDGIITVTATGGVGVFEYSEDGTTYQTSNAFGSLGPGNYTFTVKDANGCTATDGASLSNPTAVTVTNAYVTTDYDGNGAGVSCHPNSTSGTKNDGTIKIEGAGGTGTYQYSLTGLAYSKAYQNNSSITDLYPDRYTVSIKDSNGCPSSDHPVVVLTPPAEIVYSNIASTDLACNGIPTGTLQVEGATGGIGVLRYSLDGSTYQSSNAFSNLSANTFIVRIQDSKGCTKNTASVVIGEPSAITFSAITATPQSCSEIVDGSIAFAPASGGTGSRQYSIDGTNYKAETASIEFKNLVSANYTLYVKDSKGCHSTTNSYVGSRAVITGSIVVKDAITCNGKSDGSLNLTPAGGTSPYTYSWSTGALVEDIAELGDGFYTVLIKDSKGCSKSFSYHLQEPAVLSLQPVVADHGGYGVSCKGSTDGTIDLTVSGGTLPYSYAWSSGSTQEDVSAVAAGIYSVNVTDAHACVASYANIVVTEPTAVGLSLGGSKNISCHAGSDGALSGLASGGVGQYEYSLDGTTWQEEAQFEGLTAKAYILRSRDANGCVATPLNYTLTEPVALVLSLVKKTDTSCGASNGSAEIQASGGVSNYEYSWVDEANAVISTATVASNLASGDYTAKVKDGNGCNVSTVVIINDSDGPKITQQLLTGLTCFESNDGAIGISVSDGVAPYSIVWDTQETSPNINNVTGGEHWVEVLDAKGCRGKETFYVDFPAALSILHTATMPLCYGNSDGSIAVVASGGNAGGYTYEWSTGNTTATLEGVKAGSYTLIIRDTRNCTLSQDIVLQDPAPFEVDAGGDRTICVGQKLTVAAQEDNAIYLWTSDAGYTSTDREVTLAVPARYTLKVINHNGCEAEDSFILGTSNDLLQADFLMAGEAHAGDTVVLIDVSWPIPEAIDWTFPAGVQVISQDAVYAEVIFESPGDYAVILNTHLGECLDNYAKTITILDAVPQEGGRQGSGVVERFEVYPNPNEGVFTIAIDFTEAVNGRLRLMSMSGNKVFTESLAEVPTLTLQTTLQHIPAGIYFLVLEVDSDVFYKRVIIK